MTDYLQQMRVRPPLQPAYGYEKEFGDDGILYQLENRNDTQKYKLTTQNNIQKPPPYKHYTKMSNSTNDMFFPRKDPSIPPQRSKSKTQIVRPQSTGKMNKVAGLSISLQLDQDRFVERRRSFDQREYIARQKQEEYENYLRQRSLRASMKEGKEFLELSKRNYEWLQQKEEKRLKQQLQHDQQEQVEILQYRKKLLEHVHKPIPITDHRSWKDIEFEANQNRLENISRRKEELRQRSQSPFPMKRSNSDYGSSSGGGLHQRRKSESNLQLNLSSLLSGRDRATTSSSNLGYTTGNNFIANNNNKPSKSLTSKKFVHFMEKRQNEYIQRKFQREEKLLQKEREEKEKSLHFEKMKYEKILRAPLPIGCERLTRAAEEREKMVKARLDKEKHEEEMRAKKAEQQRIKQKEIAAVLRTVISQNENDRKSRHGGYIELSSSTGATQSAQERAKHGKESYQASLRANQKRIEDVLENRPTLLRRYEEDLARQAAAKRALVKIAHITDSVATDTAAATAAAHATRKQKKATRSSSNNKSKEHKHSSSRANGHNHDDHGDDDGDDEYENSKSRRHANIPRSESKDSQQDDDDCDDRRSNNDDDDHKSVNDNNNNTNDVNDNYDDDNFEDTVVAATKSSVTVSATAESK